MNRIPSGSTGRSLGLAVFGRARLGAILLAVVASGLAGSAVYARISDWRVTTPASAVGDTVVVFGPLTVASPTGSPQLQVERFELTVTPGQRYLLRVENGLPDGSARVTGGAVVLNGSEILSDATLAAGGSGWTRVVEARTEDTLHVTVEGAAAAQLKVSMLATVDGSFPVFGTERFIRQNGTPATDLREFTLPSSAGAPFRLCLVNGDTDGTDRIASASIKLNGVEVVGSTDLSQQVASLSQDVTLQATNTLEIRLTAQPDGFVDLCVMASDIAPPVITVSTPVPDLVTRDTVLTVSGSVEDQTAVAVSVNGTAATMGSNDTWSADVSLTEGLNTLTITATDAAGNQTDSVRTVRRDREAPVVTITDPAADGYTADSIVAIAGMVTDASAVTVNINGTPVSVDSLGVFSTVMSSTSETNVYVVNATDAAGNATSAVRIVRRDLQAPTLTVSAPVDGDTTTLETVTVSGTVVDSNSVLLTVNGDTATLVNGAFERTVSLLVGQNTVLVVATDAFDNVTTVSRTVVRSAPGPTGPPDPSTVASAIDPTQATNLHSAMEFLWTGPDPIQTGVAPGVIVPRQMVVLRGRVLDRNALPLTDASVRVVQHPEFGETRSRADGRFDIVANGGHRVTLEVSKSGFLPVQRTIAAPLQRWVTIDSVVLIPLDPNVTTVDFTDPIEVARGSVVTDSAGTRQATLMFQQGTTAHLVLPDGSQQPLSSLSVRATEYTVGPLGVAAMPAELPPATAYTYAAELSADEAIAAGAREVVFSQPVSVYVDNFLDFPVGGIIPVGYYDRQQAVWKADKDGRVISVVGISNGLADIAVTSAATAAPQALLDSLGITNAEREQLATLYSVGKTLWRVQHTHFTPVDYNPAPFPDEHAEPAKIEPELSGAQFDEESPCADGSIIGCQNQTLGERVAVAGTPFALSYTSDRAFGFRNQRRITIPAQEIVDTALMSVPGTVLTRNQAPSHVVSASYVLRVAGREIRQGPFTGIGAYPAATLEWDGNDAAGRRLVGERLATVSVEYTYRQRYATSAATSAVPTGFFGTGLPPGYTDAGVARAAVPVVQSWEQPIGTFDAMSQGLGGWTLSAHHAYNPATGILYQGDGSRRSAAVMGRSVVPHSTGPGGGGVAIGHDGSIYIAFSGYVERYSPDGSTPPVVVAGVVGQDGYSGEGLPATESFLGFTLGGLAVGPDGLLYIADNSENRIRRVEADGTLRTFAGTGAFISNGDGGSALSAGIRRPTQLAFLPDGSLLFTERGRPHVRRITPNGVVRRFAGSNTSGNTGDGGLATEALLIGTSSVGEPLIAAGADGSVFVSHSTPATIAVPNPSHVIRRIRPDGIIERFAGQTSATPASDTPARMAFLGTILHLNVSASGDLHFAVDAQIHAITPAGDLRVIAGSVPRCSTTCSPAQPMDRGLATQFRFNGIRSITNLPDGRIFVVDPFDSRRYFVTPALPGFDETDILIANEDGGALHHFNQFGRHLRTLDAMTGDTLLVFVYDSVGRLASVTDADGEVTTIERDGAGVATAIVAPHGQRTALEYDVNGYLDEVRNDAGERVTFVTGATGLLQSMTDPRGGVYAFTYDSLGRLVSDSSASGRVQTLARVETDTSSIITRTDDLGRTTTYRLDRLGLQSELRTTTDAAGLVTVSTSFANDSTVSVAPDGTTQTTTNRGDSRFGAQSPVLQRSETRLPSGLMSVMSSSRTTTLANSADPMSLTTLLDSMRVNNRVYRSLYTRATRTLVTTSPMGRTTSTLYDTTGRVVSSTVPGIEPTVLAYDARGRLAQTQTGGRISTFAYDERGRLLSITDPLNRTDSLFYDAADRLTRRVLPDGRSVAFAYDSAGNLTGVTPPGKPAHTFEYAPADQLAAYNPPTNGLGTSATTYVYNTAGQVTAIRRPTGDSISFGYDLAGRPSSVGFDRGAIGFAYHGTTGTLTSLSAPGGLGLAFTYDGSLPTSVTWSGTVSGSTAVTYDNNFRVTGQTVNGAHAVSFGYDLDGLLTQAGALGLRRDAQNGRLDADSVLADGAAQKTAYSYDAHGALDALVSTRDADTLFATHYTRDSLSRITTLTERVAGVTQTIGFTYDSVGRLSAVARNGVTTASYTYDLNGNRATKTTSGGVATATVDDQDRLTSYGGATYAYTNNGELTRKIVGTDTTLYTYDALGNLTHVRLSDGTAIGYLIDAQNRRIGKTVNDTLVRAWLYQGQLTPVAELDGQGTVVSRFVYATGVNVPDYLVRDDSTYRLIRDHLGSVRLVVNVASGTVAQRLAYDEFGIETENTNPAWQPFGYAGGLTDAETGLVRFGARDYDPASGRWTAKDPIGLGGGAGSFYDYVGADPMNHVDPQGRYKLTVSLVGAGVGAIISSSFSIVGQLTFNHRVDWRDVGLSAFGGAVQGFVAAAMVSNGFQGSGREIGAISGAIAGGAEALLRSYLDGDCPTETSINVLMGAAMGSIGGAIGGSYNSVRSFLHPETARRMAREIATSDMKQIVAPLLGTDIMQTIGSQLPSILK